MGLTDRLRKFFRLAVIGIVFIVLGGMLWCFSCSHYKYSTWAGTYDSGGVKGVCSFSDDFMKQLDCYVNEVWDVFNDKNLTSFFEPEGGEFYMLTTRMRLKCTARSKS